MAIHAFGADRVESHFRARGILDLALDIGDGLDDRRNLGIEVGLALPDLLRRPERCVGDVLLRIGFEHGRDLGNGGREPGNGGIDGGLIVGNFTFRCLQNGHVQVLALLLHLVLLLDGYVLLRHDGAGAE